jgi:hypothetical protein
MKLKLFGLLLFFIIFISGCIQTTPVIEDFTFNSGESRCASGGEEEIEIVGGDNKILFSGYVITSDPCHELKASYSLKDSVIEINITNIRTSDVCILCVGNVSFDGEIKIREGHYTLRIVSEETILAEKEVDVT